SERALGHEYGEVEEDREDEVHRWTGQNHDHSLVEGEALERSILVLRKNQVTLGLLEHLHVATEREKRDTVLGFPAAEAKDFRPKPQTEGDDLHPECLRKQEMPHLVHEDQRTDQQDEVQEIHGLSEGEAACDA